MTQSTEATSPISLRPCIERLRRLDLADGGVLLYTPALFSPSVASELFVQLRDQAPWDRMKFRGHLEPRATCWFGEYDYHYVRHVRPAHAFSPLLVAMREVLERVVFGPEAGGHFDGVFINLYRTGRDRISLHTDGVRDLEPDAPIASVSLGAKRRFVLRHNESGERVELWLAHGSCLVMAGTTQRFWMHELPSDPKCAGPRINLTFRQRVRSQ